MYNPEEMVDLWKMDIEAAERRATEKARFRHLKSKEREMFDAALAKARRFLRKAFDPTRGKPTAVPTSKELSY
jgi:hypothetical protein